MTDWKPIADIPAELKDGRPVDLWFPEGRYSGFNNKMVPVKITAFWHETPGFLRDETSRPDYWWWEPYFTICGNPTHYAIITPPEETP